MVHWVTPQAARDCTGLPPSARPVPSDPDQNRPCLPDLAPKHAVSFCTTCHSPAGVLCSWPQRHPDGLCGALPSQGIVQHDLKGLPLPRQSNRGLAYAGIQQPALLKAWHGHLQPSMHGRLSHLKCHLTGCAGPAEHVPLRSIYSECVKPRGQGLHSLQQHSRST